MKLRIAVSPPAETWDHPTMPAFVDALEALGFDTVWLSDIPMGSPVDPVVGLSFAAGRTTRLKLGANLVPLGRNPLLLAKSLAQLDRLSNGRLLLSFVPGLDQPGEREALSVGDGNRGAYLDEVLPLIRRFWSGDSVDHHTDRFQFTDIVLQPAPLQDPLEIWLGGVGPAALRRAGRLSDGWLGAAVTPDEAGLAREAIVVAADAADRTIDPEHFGLSIPFARTEPAAGIVAALRARRSDGELDDILPVGADQLRSLIKRLADQGLSKFVLRPVNSTEAPIDELHWLADAVLDLQT
jgi:probable F420-dependent oxidoreductase